jgi:hypothetical protein
VLVTNRRMLGLLRARGDATVSSNDWTTLRLVVGTAGHVPTWPADPGGTDQPDRPRVLVETPGGRWHAGAEAQAAGLQVIASHSRDHSHQVVSCLTQDAGRPAARSKSSPSMMALCS